MEKYKYAVLAVDGNLSAKVREIVDERCKALQMYKELIEKVQRMNAISDKREMQVDTNYQITRFIESLEEKYYPRPIKTFREKINDIINKNYDGILAKMRGELISALKEEKLTETIKQKLTGILNRYYGVDEWTSIDIDTINLKKELVELRDEIKD